MLVVFFLMENGVHGTQLMWSAWWRMGLMWKLHLLHLGVHGKGRLRGFLRTVLELLQNF